MSKSNQSVHGFWIRTVTANFLQAMYEKKLEFPGGNGGGGLQNKKTFRGGSMDIFWSCTFIKKVIRSLNRILEGGGV